MVGFPFFIQQLQFQGASRFDLLALGEAPQTGGGLDNPNPEVRVLGVRTHLIAGSGDNPSTPEQHLALARPTPFKFQSLYIPATSSPRLTAHSLTA